MQYNTLFVSNSNRLQIAAANVQFFVKLSDMNKKTSDKLDVGGEDFEAILNFITEDSEAPPIGEQEQKEWTSLKTLLLAPAQNRRALRTYLQQTSSLQKGENIKKAA